MLAWASRGCRNAQHALVAAAQRSISPSNDSPARAGPCYIGAQPLQLPPALTSRRGLPEHMPRHAHTFSL